MKYLILVILTTGCGILPESETSTSTGTTTSVEDTLKLNNTDCIDPDLNQVADTTSLMLCDGSVVIGQFVVPQPLNAENFISENIKSGVTIAGVTGSYEGVAPQQVDTSDLTNLLPENIKSGVSINGVTGSLVTEGRNQCTSHGQTDCIATADYKSTDLSALMSSNIKMGVSVAGVTGSLVVEGHSDCSAHGQEGCISSTLFKSTDLTSLTSANLKSGFTLAGVTGNYPSASNPLVGANSVANLDLATFDAKIKTVADFEWFDAEGNRYSRSGDVDLSAENIKNGVTVFGSVGTYGSVAPAAEDVRAGVTVAGVTGSLKTQCRNTYFSTVYGVTGLPTNEAAGGSIPDGAVNSWETLEDAGAFPQTFTTQQVAGWSEDNMCGDESWEVTGSSPCTVDGSFCMVKDKISGLTWSNQQQSNDLLAQVLDWSQSISKCESLDFEGFTDWRVPTQKEAMQAYVNGMGRINIPPFINLSDDVMDFWTSTTAVNLSNTSAYASANVVRFKNGILTSLTKANLALVMCVR